MTMILSRRLFLDMIKPNCILLSIILAIVSCNISGQQKLNQQHGNGLSDVSVLSAYFNIGINSIDFKGKQFEGFRFSAGLAKSNESKKVSFKLGMGYSNADNHDSSATTYDSRLNDTVLVYLNTRLDRLDLKPEVKYRLSSTLKKNRYVCFALMFNTNFLSKKIVNPTPQMDLIDEKYMSYSLTPMLSYFKEKRLNVNWSFTGELSYGINLPTQTSYYYAGIGLAYKF